jgi:hypothetical protein
MGSLAHYYRRAVFRPGVEYVIGEDRAVFSYDTISFDIEYNQRAGEEIARLCARLAEGLELQDLTGQFLSFEPYARDIISAFDRYGLLTEGSPPQPEDIITGEIFWQEIDAFAHRAKAKFRPVLYQALREGMVGRDVLIRYATQYYYIVWAGPQIIAGVLPHASDPVTRSILEEFLASELGHDKLLTRSLESAGVNISEVQASLPLPETFALISGLQVLADQEPLSFKALVFLLEEASPEFHDAFVTACGQSGLCPDFWQPIVSHSNINDTWDHGSMSKRLLSQVKAVTTEERLVVLKHVAIIIESLIALERAILD